MAREKTFLVPPPPKDQSPDALLRWAADLYVFLTQVWPTGLQCPFFAQEQLDEMTATTLSQSGRIFFNSTTGKFNCGEIDSGNLVIKEIVTT